MHPSWLLLAESTAIPSSARLVLFCLIGLLLVILGVLIAFAVHVRKRGPVHAAPSTRDASGPLRMVMQADGGDGESAYSGAGAGVGGAGMMAVVSSDNGRGCPTCGQYYESSVRFCPGDARPLVSVHELGRAARARSTVCPSCTRSFEAGVRVCPHDATELVSLALFEATRGRVEPITPVGVTGKICPHCRRQFDLARRFCAHDGTELAPIN